MNNIKIGLIKGRHELPVNEFLFENEIKDVNDFNKLENYINNWLDKNLTYSKYYGAGINQIDCSDVEIQQSNEQLTVYVTGLTQVTASLIKCCMNKGVYLNLMHYDRETNSYKEQTII